MQDMQALFNYLSIYQLVWLYMWHANVLQDMQVY